MTAEMPDYVAIWDDDRPDVDIHRHTRFTWRPRARELGVSRKATPELLTELAATGAIDDIQILTVDEWAKDFPNLPNLPKAVAGSLRRVSINSARFTDWGGVYALPALEELCVDEKVKVFPDGVGALKSLRRLEVKGSRLKELPADVGALTNLEELEIVRTHLAGLPEEIGRLPLKSLSLIWTGKLKGLPDSLGECATLRELHTDSAPLKALPDGLYTSEGLETLSLIGAKLSKLGPHIHWPSLRVLTLSGSFKKWPSDVSLPVLEEFVLESGVKVKRLPGIFNPALKHARAPVPLEVVDPRLATIEDQTEGRRHLGVRLTCTQTAYNGLGEQEREAFGSRLRVD